MKLRLRPLRGQTYGIFKFLEMAGKDSAQVLTPNSSLIVVHIDQLKLPIIDTKDYEKIPEDKHVGH